MGTSAAALGLPSAWQRVEPLPDSGKWAVMGTRTTQQTLQVMAKHVNDALRNRRVVELATALVSDVPGNDYPAMLRVIRDFVESRFRFIRDPYGQELLRTPEYLLQRIQQYGVVQGDCDDAAQLVAVLGKAIGFPADFCTVSFDPAGRVFTHVYAVLSLPSGERVEFDVTRPPRFRFSKPPFTAKAYYRV